MVSIYKAKIELPMGSCPPDTASATQKFYPPENFVVSRQKNGEVLSIFRENKWDLSPYNGRGESSVISFAYWGRRHYDERMKAIILAAKKLMFILIWRRSGAPYAVSTLCIYGRLIGAMAEYCYKSRITIEQFLSDKTRALWFIRCAGGSYAKTLLSLASMLRRMRAEMTGFQIFSVKAEIPIRKIAKANQSKNLQTAPIPTRIYEEALTALVNELSDFEAVETELLSRLETLLTDPRSRRSRVLGHMASSAYHERQKQLQGVVSKELRGYLADRGLGVHTYDLMSAITCIQVTCKTFLHAFSGARNKELAYAKYNCLKTVVLDGLKYYLIVSTMTKSNGGIPKGAYWVTCRESERFVKCAQRICKFIYKISRSYFPKLPKKLNGNETLLFLSSGYLYRGRRAPKRPNRPLVVRLSRHWKIFHGADLRIRDDDLKELEEIDQFRAWRKEPQFKMGATWPMRWNQFRRSLPLYGKASGLVSSTTIRRMLKHVSAGLAEFYSNGSASARDILKMDGQHMCGVYQESQPTAEALHFLRDLVHSREEWAGPLAAFVDRHVRSQGVGTIVDSLQFIEQQVALGQIAYQETSLGGCGKPGPCDKRAMRSYISCIDCPRAGIKKSKLDAVIERQIIFVERLTPGTMERSAEEEDLRALKEYRVRKFG
ncbi:hypothetical protein AB4Y35_18370 [Paraburkholderia sp. EG286A]|uniref:hypothetical protein n=1 Tax=Paraburkholderia sp. EG286A TaxID=3237014 RepID=UPI0034D36E2D